MSLVNVKMLAVNLSTADIRTAAHLLVRCCSEATVAALLNDLLNVEADEALTDAEAAAGVALFGELVKGHPAAVTRAQGGDPDAPVAMAAHAVTDVEEDVASEKLLVLEASAIKCCEMKLRGQMYGGAKEFPSIDKAIDEHLDSLLAQIAELNGEAIDDLRKHYQAEARLNLGLPAEEVARG